MERSGPPKSRKHLQSLLGTLNFIRELIPKYSREAKVLYQGTREGKWQWTEAMETARLKLIRMALDTGELEFQDEKVPLEVNIHEDGASFSCSDKKTIAVESSCKRAANNHIIDGW